MVGDHNHFSHRDSEHKGMENFSFNLQNVKEFREKRTVALMSVCASAGLAATKLVIGYSTNSLGILSEAMHSGLDLIAVLMTLYAVTVVIRPPDLSFTYGYGKIESLSSLIQISLLFAVAAWIFYEGLLRIIFKHTPPEITIFSFAIMGVSIVIDLWRSRVLYRTARKYGSQALEADALHFKADMFSSSIVILGLIFVLFFKIPNADAIAALVIGVVIIYTSLGLGRRTIDVLLDRAPKGLNHLLLESISGLEGVSKAHDIRIRNMGSTMSVDLHIEVPRTSTHGRAHKIATNVEDRVREVIPNSDVLVHVDAIETSTETMTDKIRLIAAETEGIKNVHSIYFSKIMSHSLGKDSVSDTILSDEKQNLLSPDSLKRNPSENNISSADLHLYLDLEVDRNQDLKTAHARTDSFEQKIKTEIPQVKYITTHIETESGEDGQTTGVEKRATESYIDKIRSLVMQANCVIDCKDIGIVEVNEDHHITLTIVLKAKNGQTISVEDAHAISTKVQEVIMRATGASRVVVHSEPASDE
ncbi:MAG: cation diffusion facilitator family transporter [Nitrososphaerota archaeon]